ncbi:MAG TPA: FG-GAP-like repeat-containing protein [Gemmataceae bacterium]|nr:FG-GAP-like repeat-containing protein [Gemmataceae bacterium]
MSFHSWLQNLRSALAPGRGHRKHGRRSSLRAVTHRPNVEVLEARCLPAFLAPVSYAAGGYVGDVKAGDFNGDTVPDLVAANTDDNAVSVLLGNGDGTFQSAQTFAVSPWPESVAVGDFNEDGKLDLATANYDYYGDNDVGILLGHGDGTFAPAVPLTNGTTQGSQGIATGDLNADGHKDLVVTSDSVGDFTQPYVSVILGNGDGTFAPAVAYILGIGGLPSAPVLADFDSDGNADVAWADWDVGSVKVLLGNGDGTFRAARSFAASGSSVAAADVNGDVALDLVVSGVSVLLGIGDGSFAPPIPTGTGEASVVVADFNADGRPDAAAAKADTVSVLINDGNWPAPDTPAISISDATVTEVNAGTITATFTVTLSHAAAVDVTVHYATADGSAGAGSDYQAASGTLLIPAGQTTGTVTVLVNGDRLGEANETFAVTLSGPTNAFISDAQGVGTIVDNEPRISITDVTKAEGKKGKTTLFTFTVTLSVPYDQPVTVSFQTVNGTATTGDNDYVGKTGTLTFAPGETTKTITIEVKGDSKKEADETFYLDLFDNSSNSLFTKKHGLGTILNDD